MTKPSVSICIPVYNMAATLEESVTSVVRQSYGNWELVIVDNASTDGSAQLAEKLAVNDSRIRVMNVPQTVPMVENYNNCLRHADGQYITILSADDLLLPDFLQECLNIFNKGNNLGYVACSRSVINEKGEVLPQTSFYHSSGIVPGMQEARVNLAGNHSTPSCMLCQRQALDTVGGYPLQFPFCFDIYSKLRLNMAHDMGYIAKPLCQYRVTGKSGPSLYRQDDYSPVFELYQIKRKILDEMSVEPQERADLSGKIQVNLARVCMFLAQFAMSEKKEIDTARTYMQFAVGFSPDIEFSPQFQTLSSRLSGNRHEVPVSDQVCQGPPYDLPSGSRLMKVKSVRKK